VNKAATLVLAISLAAPAAVHAQTSGNPLVALWSEGKPAFGIFVPNEKPVPRGQAQRPREMPAAVYTREGGAKLAANPLYDFVFLNLEGRYDAAAVKAISEGLRSAKGARKALIVRIPTIEAEGADAAKVRVKEAFALGADGVTIPHVRSVDEAKLAIGFFKAANVNVWSPSNPTGDKIAMLMIEDPGALAQAAEIADLEGYSVLACGIGSLTRALGNDAAAGEAGTQKVLAESKRVKLPNMLTATVSDVEKRVKEGFLGILAMGEAADDAIKRGLVVAGRQAPRPTASVNQQPRLDVLNMARPIDMHDSVWIEDLTMMEVRDLLKAGKTTALILTGGIEENGPYLTTGKHNNVLKVTGESIARSLGNALVAPIVTLEPGNPERVRTPGTVFLSPETYRAVLSDMATSLKTQGFRHIIFLGDSGGNQKPMQEVSLALNAKWAGDPSDARTHFIPEYYNYEDVEKYQGEVLGIHEKLEGLHDDYYISSIIMVHDPKAVRMDERIKAGKFSINGVSLAPAEKTIENGRKIIAFRTEKTVAAIKKALAAGTSP
jgi:creatinine amidohydrolase/Fe(II)-dependent formamide hydrolase-like protein/2-keto-3-deoxy-L-rhamnonate aldolase RhmA